MYAGDLQVLLAHRGLYPPLFSSQKLGITQLQFMLLKQGEELNLKFDLLLFLMKLF